MKPIDELIEEIYTAYVLRGVDVPSGVLILIDIIKSLDTRVSILELAKKP